MNPLLTVKELSNRLNVSPSTIYYWVERNEIPLLRMGKHLRFRLDEVIAFFEKKTAERREHCVGTFNPVEPSSRSLAIRKGALLRVKE
jgi:excisionase family DNA binding protein